MASMNVSLPDPMRVYVQKQIDSGQYASVSDYVRDLIRRDQRLDEEREHRLRDLDAAVDRSFEDLRAGRVSDADKVFDRLEAKYRSMAESGSAGRSDG